VPEHIRVFLSLVHSTTAKNCLCKGVDSAGKAEKGIPLRTAWNDVSSNCFTLKEKLICVLTYPKEHSDRKCFHIVLLLAGIELIFFLITGVVLCFGFGMKIMLITY